MAWPAWQEKNNYFYWLEWRIGITIIYGIYIFSICWPRGEEKKKVYIDYKKRKHKAIF